MENAHRTPTIEIYFPWVYFFLSIGVRFSFYKAQASCPEGNSKWIGLLGCSQSKWKFKPTVFTGTDIIRSLDVLSMGNTEGPDSNVQPQKSWE